MLVAGSRSSRNLIVSWTTRPSSAPARPTSSSKPTGTMTLWLVVRCPSVTSARNLPGSRGVITMSVTARPGPGSTRETRSIDPCGAIRIRTSRRIVASRTGQPFGSRLPPTHTSRSPWPGCAPCRPVVDDQLPGVSQVDQIERWREQDRELQAFADSRVVLDVDQEYVLHLPGCRKAPRPGGRREQSRG